MAGERWKAEMFRLKIQRMFHWIPKNGRLAYFGDGFKGNFRKRQMLKTG